jgi:M3 family oligoendopeptidase
MSKELAPFEAWPWKVPSIKSAVKKTKGFTAAFVAAPSQEDAFKVWKKVSKYSDNLSNEVTHIQVLYSLDTTNKTYEKAMNKMNEGLPLVQAASLEFEKALLASPYRPYLTEKLGAFYFQMVENSLKGFDEKIIPEAQKENDLSMKYGALIASAKVPFRGGTYNLPQMGKFMQDLDRETRKEASDAYYSYLDTQMKDQLENIYDELVKVRTAMAKKLGYPSYTELGYIRMSRYDYTPEMVAAYREQIREEVTPLASKILKAQFKRTGIKKPKIYDMALTFKDGNPTSLRHDRRKSRPRPSDVR